MPSKAYSNSASAKRGREWYKKNKSKKIAYEKARKDEHLARYYARKKMGTLGKGGGDVHHKNGNPLDGRRSNLQVVNKDHSKGRKGIKRIIKK